MTNNNKLGVRFNIKPSPVPDKVRVLEFGCGNCLWCSCECVSGSMYKPKSDNDIECNAYTYYD